MVSEVSLNMHKYLVKNFIFTNRVKRHICDDINSRLGHDLRILVNHRVISAFHEDFIFTKLCICEASRK